MAPVKAPARSALFIVCLLLLAFPGTPLGVPAANVKVVARGESRRLAELARVYADKSAVVLTAAVGGDHLAPESAPKWKAAFVN